jgi:adenylate kinase family enzyme
VHCEPLPAGRPQTWVPLLPTAPCLSRETQRLHPLASSVVVERILVYGVTGSGKTTLAAGIAARTGLPWYSVDDLTWLPGWAQVPTDEQRRTIAAICSRDRWVLDTAYSQWLDVPLSRVELIVALDFPRWISLGRLLKRTARRIVRQDLICNGNRESLRQQLSRESIIWWHFKSFARKRARIRTWVHDPLAPPIVHLTSPRQVSRWLETLEAVYP